MGWLGRAVFGNLLLKLSALVCAGVLWVYVDSALRADSSASPLQIEERTFDVAFQIPPKAVDPLEVRRPDGRVLPVNNVHVQVTVRGPALAVRSLRENVDVRGTIGVPGGLREGPVSLPIGEESISVPRGRGLEVVAIHPRQVEFLLVPRGTKPATEHQ